MTIYVSTDDVKRELERLAKSLKARIATPEGLSPLAVDLEISLANYAIVAAVDTGVMQTSDTLKSIDRLLSMVKK